MHSEIKILPLGGLGEIGMNCMIIEGERELFLIDCGFLFSDLEHFGVEYIVPDFKYVLDRKEKFKGFFLTHGHEDHIGALPFAFKAGLDGPVYASNFTSHLIRRRMEEFGLTSRLEIHVLQKGQTVALKEFQVTPYPVTHSIVDAMALIVQTPIGKIIHTGDFRMDGSPFFGEAFDPTPFKEAGDQGVLLLLSDSTNVEIDASQASESTLIGFFDQMLSATKGLTVISLFSSNVGRMGQILTACKKYAKKVFISGRSMSQNVHLGMETGFFPEAATLINDASDLAKFKREDCVVLSTGCQGEMGSSLNRIAYGDNKQIRLQQGDRVVLSSKVIPGNEKPISRLINQLFKQGADVVYDATHRCHVSGHASRPELKKMLQWTRPKFFIPVHGEYRHLVHHRKLAVETNVPEENALLVADGEVVALTPDSCKVVEKVEGTRILIDGPHANDLSALVIKERRKMAETGAVFCLLIRSQESRLILSGPEIITHGLVNEKTLDWYLEESKNSVLKLIDEYEERVDKGDYSEDLQETVRVHLRRFFNKNIGKKPVVVVMIQDI